MKVAALYVIRDGPYYGMPDVDPWDEERDARSYAGPYPVVAHPPCQRYGRYWSGGPSAKVRRKKGDDGGCFAAALDAVRRWGGVLEHPEASHAWRMFGLTRPPKSGGWSMEDDFGGVTCCVEQGQYGHRARKATWLYAVGIVPPAMEWGKCRGPKMRLEPGFKSTEEGRRARLPRSAVELGSKRERAATPVEFRDLLLGMARSVYKTRALV